MSVRGPLLATGGYSRVDPAPLVAVSHELVPVRHPDPSASCSFLGRSYASDGSGNISDLIVAADPKTILADGQEVWLANLPLEYPDYVLWDPVITFVENRR